VTPQPPSCNFTRCRMTLRGPGSIVASEAQPKLLERRVANLIADSIQPTLLPEIEIVPWRRMHVLVVQVHPSALRPHHLKAEGVERGTYVRLGSTNRRADAALIAELRRRIDLESYDEQPLPAVDSELSPLTNSPGSWPSNKPLLEIGLSLCTKRVSCGA
jgi:hypothetical protein